MKPFLTVLFILFSIGTIAQKVDSLEIRLTQYKTLLEKDLITKDEYNELKAKELGIKVVTVDLNAKEKNENLETAINNTKKSIKHKVGGGIILTVFGVAGLIGGGVIFANELLYKPNISPSQVTNTNVSSPHVGSAIVLTMGGVLSIPGIVSFISAAVEHSKLEKTILQKD